MTTVITNPGGVKNAYSATLAIGATGNGLTCPPNKKWVLEALVADVVCSATVGNRILIARVGNIFWVSPSSAAVTAGQTGGIDVSFGTAGAPSTTVRRNIANTGNTNVQVIAQCPIKTLTAGDTLTVQDTAAIDVADSISFRAWYVEYDI